MSDGMGERERRWPRRERDGGDRDDTTITFSKRYPYFIKKKFAIHQKNLIQVFGHVVHHAAQEVSYP